MNNLLWSEEYRPKTIDECVLPTNLKTTFEQVVSTGMVPNMLLTGSHGRGKTTAARAMCEELDLDYMMINGSEDSGIEVLRTTLRQFASTCSLQGGDKPKVIIVDEADYLNPVSTQPALRGFIQEFNKSCRFIFTCNYPNKIIEPIRDSRMTKIEFKITKKDLPLLAAKFHKRMCGILDLNKVKYDPKLVAQVVMSHAPDWRRVIEACQIHSMSGTLSPEVLHSLSDDSFAEVIGYLKDKNFGAMRKWVGMNSDLDATAIYRKIYDSLALKAEPSSIPAACIIIAEYQYKHAHVSDHEINTVACLTELMRDCKWA